ncbi:MAG: hypothetical protein J6J21_06050 [Clostridia bacterium]|nr:hypothetical protein [Clostridia bacterium]
MYGNFAFFSLLFFSRKEKKQKKSRNGKKETATLHTNGTHNAGAVCDLQKKEEQRRRANRPPQNGAASWPRFVRNASPFTLLTFAFFFATFLFSRKKERWNQTKANKQAPRKRCFLLKFSLRQSLEKRTAFQVDPF